MADIANLIPLASDQIIDQILLNLSMDIFALSLPEMCGQLRAGQLTSEDLTRAYLERIEKYDGALRAYEFVAGEMALKQARAMDALRASGTDLGCLMGIPIAVKDVFNVDGFPTGVGSALNVSSIFGSREASLIEKLKRAGCVILGKTKTAEFALSSSGINYRNGTPRNPWDGNTVRVPGGSSSGSAVAVAADLCAFALGTDTGGSVRTPAAFCGVVGVKFGKKTFDSDGVFPLSHSLDSMGVLTRHVACAQLIADVLGVAPPERTAVSRLKLGILNIHKKLNLDPEVQQCWDAALQCLASAGHVIKEICVDEWHAELDNIYSTITRTEIFASLSSHLNPGNEHLINPDILRKIESGRGVKSNSYVSAIQRREELIQVSNAMFSDYDVLITPTKGSVASAYPSAYAGRAEDDKVLAKTGVLTREANVLDMTGVSLPIHQFGSPLPVGLQVMCRGDHISRLLKSAAIIEACVGSAPRPDLKPFAI